MPNQSTQSVSQAPKKRNKTFVVQSIAFGFLWVISLGIMIIGSIMASTNFSFGENPHYRGKFDLNLSEVVEGEKVPIEKEQFILGEDMRGLVEIYIQEHLPTNIVPSKTIINEIKIDGQVVENQVILTAEKSYVVSYDCYIKYDSSNIIVRASLQTVSLVLIVFGIIWYTIEEQKQKDKAYLREKEVVEETSAIYLPIVWQSYEDSTNEKRKIKQWKAYCIREENKLDKRKKFMRKKDIAKYENNLRVWLYGTEEEKLNNEYCVAKARLRLYQSDEWIEQNIKHKLVKYDPISYRLVFVGKDINNRQDNPNEYITKNQGGIILIDNMPRLLVGLAFSIVLTLLVVDMLTFDITAITGAILGLASMAWNSYLSFNYGRKFFNNNTFADMCFRSGIAKEFTSYLRAFSKEPELPKIQEKVEVVKNEEPENRSDGPNENQITETNDGKTH